MSRLLLLTFSIIFLNIAKGQETNNKPTKWFGIKAGANYSSLNFKSGYQSSHEEIVSGWKPGIVAGIYFNIKASNKIIIQPEYLYSQMGGKITNAATVYRINYLSMPLIAKYLVSNKFRIEAGPQLGLLINAKDNSSGKFSDITHDIEERSIGFIGGVEYQFAKNLYIDARYLQGLSHVSIGIMNSSREFVHQVIQVSVSTNF